MDILYIDCCIRREASRTRCLSHAFLSYLKEMPGERKIVERCLMDMDLRYLAGDFFEEREMLLSENKHTHPRFDYAREFARADKIIVAAPFWDLSIPALLKVYIENISVDGITFYCDENGMHGKCKADTMIFITTRGSITKNGPLEMGSKYMEALCQMYGIEHYACLAAEGLDLDSTKTREIMEETKKQIPAMAERYFGNTV